MIAQPIALSVAPVALVHESRWPPSITTSSALSVPGISATVTYDVLPSGKYWFWTLNSTVTGVPSAMMRKMRP